VFPELPVEIVEHDAGFGHAVAARDVRKDAFQVLRNR
jgi:hypothetical protein